ncbi:hypothetical protein [Anaerotignum sp.]
MVIKLVNGTELNPLSIYGGDREVQGAKRDTLYFVFHVEEGIETLDTLFTEENCETITITEDSGDSFIHSGYTIRVELSKKNMVIDRTENNEPIYEDRLTVAMAQRTPAENQIKEMENAMDTLLGV